MADRLSSALAVCAITVFFAVMWGVHLRRNLAVVQPPLPTPRYEALLDADEDGRFARWDVLFGNRVIGRASAGVQRQSEVLLRVVSAANFELGPVAALIGGSLEASRLDIIFEAYISTLNGLRYFELRSEALDMRVIGTTRDGELELRGRVAADNVVTSFPFDPQAFFATAMTPLVPFDKLREDQLGQQWTMDMLNPLTRGVQTVTVTVESSRSFLLEDETVKAFRLVFVAGTAEWVSWVTEDGDVLLQGSPFGLVLRRRGLPPELSAALL